MLRNRLGGLTALLALAFVVPVQAAQVDRFVPGDTEQVLVINVKQLLGSELGKKLVLPEIEKKLKDSKEYQQIQQATGLDLLKDVNTVVVANAGTTGDKFTVIIRGRFDVAKFAKVAEAVAMDKKDELKIGKVGNRPLYESVLKDGKSFWFTFIDGTTIVGSTAKDYVTAAATVGGKLPKINKDLGAALEGVDGKQSIWAVGLIPEEARKQLDNVNQGPVEALKKVKAATFTLHLTNSLAAGVSLSLSDEKAAKELGEFVDQAKGLIAFFAQSNEMFKPFADELLKTLQIKTTKDSVGVSFKLSEEIIEKASKLIPKQ